MRRSQWIAVFSTIGLFGCAGGGMNTTHPTFTVSGSLSGVITTDIVLQLNGGSDISVSGSSFTFPTTLTNWKAYEVTLHSLPSGLQCRLANASGTITGSDVSDVTLRCQPATPVLSLTPRPIKTFQFRWADVVGETEYRLLENPDGASSYTQVATLAADATSYDLEVPLLKRVNASYVLQACNPEACVSSAPVNVTGNLAEAVGYFRASNTEADDGFGFSISLAADGNTLAVGAMSEDSSATGIDGDEADNSTSQSGAVYVFTRNDGVWSQQAYVKASNTGEGDLFGMSVALAADGNTLAVGTSAEDSNATAVNGNQSDNSAASSGAVYVYTRDAGAWSQQAYLKASNTEAGDRFGYPVALAADGNTLAVGARHEDSNATGIDGDQADNSASDSGAVYIFTRNNGVWSQQAYVKASNTGGNDEFGFSVALAADGNTFAVGALGEDSNAIGVNGNQDDYYQGYSYYESGAVYVFTRNDGAWSQQAYVKASNTGQYDLFGRSVALTADGNTLAVGAPGESSNATGIDGYEANDSASGSGAVYIFTRNAGVWSQQAYLKASNTGKEDGFGFYVAMTTDGNTLAVGAPSEESNAIGVNGNQDDNSASGSGAVYVFTRKAWMWSQRDYVKASRTGDFEFGNPLDLSANGDTLAVGASLSKVGAVYLY